MKITPSISFITPTFNRATLLPKLFRSLEIQTYPIEEWIVIDDGSCDNTHDLISILDKEKKNINKIIYHKQENQGKHVAVNKGIELANGQFICIVDSDDELKKNCISYFFEILENYKIIENPQISAISGVKLKANGEAISYLTDKSNEEMSHFEWFYIKKRHGDRIDFYKKDSIKNIRFNTFPNEKFITEDTLWLRISGKKFFTNKEMLTGEYLDNGLTHQYRKLLDKNPMGMISYYQTLLWHNENYSKLRKIKYASLIIYYSTRLTIRATKLLAIPAIIVAPILCIIKYIKK